MTEEQRIYPKLIDCDGGAVEFRYMAREDEAEVLSFAQALPVHDLLFLPRDISQPKVLAAWVRENETANLTTLLAVRNGEVVGCASIVRDPLSWSAHVGELRVVVTPTMRGKGLGRALTQESFALGLTLGLEKLVAQMTADQQGAIKVFEGLGFRAEAFFRDHAKDRNGRPHDIVVLSHDVSKFMSQMEAYGLTRAF